MRSLIYLTAPGYGVFFVSSTQRKYTTYTAMKNTKTTSIVIGEMDDFFCGRSKNSLKDGMSFFGGPVCTGGKSIFI
jgi:hypothetical protein